MHLCLERHTAIETNWEDLRVWPSILEAENWKLKTGSFRVKNGNAICRSWIECTICRSWIKCQIRKSTAALYCAVPVITLYWQDMKTMVCLSFGSIISKFTLSHILLPFYQFVFFAYANHFFPRWLLTSSRCILFQRYDSSNLPLLLCYVGYEHFWVVLLSCDYEFFRQPSFSFVSLFRWNTALSPNYCTILRTCNSFDLGSM